MSEHEKRMQRIDYKLNFVKQHKPRWYGDDEQRLRSVEHHVDGQVQRIQAKETSRKLVLPDGIRAAERRR